MKRASADGKDAVRIGWREWIGLPALGIDAVKAKVDTGARTSALHAWNVEPFRKGRELWLRFEVHPLQRSNSRKVMCEARATDLRSVRNSSGSVEQRYIIETELKLGSNSWPIELALTNRDQMGFRMLLGRTALGGRVVVMPGRSFLVSPRSPLKVRRGRRRPPAPELSKLLP